MTIYRIFQNSAFGPDEIKRMASAYEDALRRLELERTDPSTEKLATKIIEIAQTGERDPKQICVKAIPAIEPRAADYKDFAEECRKLASRMSRPEDQEQLREMAAAWFLFPASGVTGRFPS